MFPQPDDVISARGAVLVAFIKEGLEVELLESLILRFSDDGLDDWL